MGWKKMLKKTAKGIAIGSAVAGTAILTIASASVEAENARERRDVRDQLGIGRAEQLLKVETELGEARLAYAHAKASCSYSDKHEAKLKIRALESVREDIRNDMGFAA